MATKGNDILIYLDGDLIGGTRSHDIDSDVDLTEVASSTSAKWKEYITGRKSWGFSVNWLMTTSQEVQALLEVDTSYTVKIKGRGSSDSTGVTGTAILKACKITATRGNLVQGSFTFQGSGALTIPT